MPDIEYGEEGLSLLALFPSASVVATGIVPEILGVAAIGTSQVIVGLRTIAREVADLLQLFVVKADEGGNLKSAAHRLRAIRDCVHSGNPGGSGRGADCAVVEAIEVTESIAGKLIDMGGLGVLGSVTADPLDAVVLAGDPKDVGFLFFSGKRKEHG